MSLPHQEPLCLWAGIFGVYERVAKHHTTGERSNYGGIAKQGNLRMLEILILSGRVILVITCKENAPQNNQDEVAIELKKRDSNSLRSNR